MCVCVRVCACLPEADIKMCVCPLQCPCAIEVCGDYNLKIWISLQASLEESWRHGCRTGNAGVHFPGQCVRPWRQHKGKQSPVMWKLSPTSTLNVTETPVTTILFWFKDIVFWLLSLLNSLWNLSQWPPGGHTEFKVKTKSDNAVAAPDFLS